jgi:hypothetical protein
MNKNNLKIDALDFDSIKDNLKNYLKDQPLFKDFDFEGAGINILLDVLAYNTHYQAFYANMVANEAFLDSAVLRNSAVSIAKQLGYTPRSIKASQVFVDVEFNNGNNSDPELLLNRVKNGTAFINRGDVFRGRFTGGSFFDFIAAEDYKLKVIDGIIKATDVKLIEGSLKTYSFVVNSFDPSQRFILPSNNIDIDTIKVRVQNSVNDTTGILDIWSKATDINSLNSGSYVYFLQESEDGRYEIYFGDGILGRSLQNGNVVNVEYILTSGNLANNCKTFVYNTGQVSAFASPRTTGRATAVTTILDGEGKATSSFGGTQAESLDSIKYYAPRNYQARERAVTTEDYKTILVSEFNDTIDSFFVWGGEENDPPSYGKVFISIKPKNGKKISLIEKLAIEKTVLGKRNLVTITPEIVDPDYIYLEINTNTTYDQAKTNLSIDGLREIITNRVNEYETFYLFKFGKDFRASKFISAIDSVNASTTGTTLNLKLQKRIEPFLAKPSPYTIKFFNQLLHPIDGYTPIVSSTSFGYQDKTNPAVVKPIVDAFLDDDGYGNIRIYKIDGQSKIYLETKVGKIDYIKGIITLNNFKPEYIKPKTESEIKITVIPQKQDVKAIRNQIINIDYQNSNFSIEPDTTYAPDAESGTTFPF